jgi:hypothetical protein
MTTTPAQPGVFFPDEVLRIDLDLSRRFASAEATFEEIVAAADEAGDKCLLALSASPLPRREEGFRAWREKQVARLLESRLQADVREYGESLEDSEWKKILSGECPLIEVEQSAVRFWDETHRERSRLYGLSKRALKLTLQKAFHDHDGENSTTFDLPQSLYFDESGEILIFRRAKNARRHGIKKGVFHVVVNIDHTTARFRRGSGT